MKQRIVFAFVVFVLGVVGITTPAQTPTGSIEGVITDPGKAVVAGATVTVTSSATGQTFTATTNDQGFFTFRSLQPGVYSIRVEQAGFSAATADNIVVQVSQVARADVSMKVGAPTETVQVQIGDTDLQVDTTRQTVDGVITGRQITTLPLNSRNFLDLAVLEPSVTVADGGAIDPTKVNAYRAVRVNGGSGTGTRVQIEGIDVTDETVGTTTANFSTDSVQEFNLQRSSFDLGTSLTTSGAISVATRTGGNKFSGSGFYFGQDNRFDARPGFELNSPEFHRDQEGYRFGGRIIKDRLFFFSNYERFNQANFSSFTSGDFPGFNASSTLPIKTHYIQHRLDGVIRNDIKVFYLHNYNDDNSTGGSIRSPFQNVDWTNTHVIGANITGSRFTHAIRLGYVNFNNRIESQELAGFEFPRNSGTAFQVNVGDISIGPNTLAPQQTYQDNFQYKYDGNAIWGKHIFRYGGEINHVILGGFANFAGPLSVSGDLTQPTVPGSADPLTYTLTTFTIGPNSGFFTPFPAHNLPFGGRTGTRYAFFVGDQWKLLKNLTLNLGLRYNYETNFFGGNSLPRIAELDRFAPNLGTPPKYPKNAFSPQVGFAWDPFGDGKTSIRGGFYLAHEANIFNNSLFDAEARIALGISPTFFDETGVFGPDNAPIVVNGIPGCLAADVANGDYTCLTGRSIAAAMPYLAQLNTALQSAYANLSNYNPNAAPNEFTVLNGNGEIVYGNDYKIPYSMQFNIGFQRELFKGNVLTVDFVRQHGIGLPVQLFDLEHRRDARFFNEAAARTSIATRIGTTPANVNPTTIAAYLATHPGTSISTFALANDTIWPGATSLTNARLTMGGFQLYQALQITLNGRLKNDYFNVMQIGGHHLFRDFNYTLSWAWATNKSTSGIGRPEFLASATNNKDINADFGPNQLDRRHIVTVSVSNGLIGGFRLDHIYRFFTPTPQNLRIPNNRGSSGIFTSDFNGDGGNGTTPRVDTLPGTNIGSFGRGIRDIAELNTALLNYNNTFAGHLTPAGQRLVQAGIFSEAQLVALGATLPVIPLVPSSNPDPFENYFRADYRLSRPVKIWKEGWILEPSISFFNVFNNSPKGQYTGLAIPNVGSAVVTNYGALNYDYAANAAADLARGRDLNRDVRGLQETRRQLQFGIRFTF
jgi:hypothetical protein